jgi:signal transduction histidine kinase/ActR/RegA family two-component response regulator
VAFAEWNVNGLLVPECLLLVSVAGTASVSANLFAPFPRLDAVNVCAQVLPVYIWTAYAVPRYGWLLPALVAIHAVAVWQALRLNSTQIRGSLSAQIALEAQTEDLRQARDAAQAAGAARMTFLANMSHEIRTPLNGIMGLADVLHGSNLSAEQRALLADISQSGKHLLSILNDILDIAKVSSGKVTMAQVPFDFLRLIRDVASPAAILAESRQLRFVLLQQPGLPEQVSGDPVRLRQILSNLLSNAVKFTVQGEVRFTVIMPAPGFIRFEVADTGIGLTPAQQRELFQEFHQVDSSTTRKFGGTGLGLAISYRLSQLMNGRLHVESRPGEGSTFFLEIPVVPAGAGVSASTIELGEQCIPGLRVLVVEDNLVNQKVTSKIATSGGAQVDIAANGREAVHRHAENPYDLILMDCQMPELDGYEATALIRKLPGRAAQVRIVGVTANAFQEDRDRCLRAGMDGYVAKPLTRQTLLEACTAGAAISSRPEHGSCAPPYRSGPSTLDCPATTSASSPA